jgi:hypothetical protein
VCDKSDKAVVGSAAHVTLKASSDDLRKVFSAYFAGGVFRRDKNELPQGMNVVLFEILKNFLV